METHLVFYLIAGLLLVTEAFTPATFLFICFSLACLITGLVDQFADVSLTWLLGINLILSTLSLFVVRPFLKMLFSISSDSQDLGKAYAEKLLGKEAMVFKDINTNEPGLVKLIDFDETWLAKSSEKTHIGAGSCVVIDAVEANYLFVSVKA